MPADDGVPAKQEAHDNEHGLQVKQSGEAAAAVKMWVWSHQAGVQATPVTTTHICHQYEYAEGVHVRRVLLQPAFVATFGHDWIPLQEEQDR